MDETREVPCAKCAAAVEGERPVTQAMRASTAAVTGGGPADGPFCAACQGEREHLYALFSKGDGLHFCGCGDPEEAYLLVRDVVSLAPFCDGHRQEVRDRIGGGDGTYYLVLYAIDNAGLLEHGGSIGGSWLTGKGTHYLSLMRKWEWEEFEQAGLPHYGRDGNGTGECGPGCPHWEASTEDYRKEAMRRHAEKWQDIPAGKWTALRDADARIMTQYPASVQSLPGRSLVPPAR